MGFARDLEVVPLSWTHGVAAGIAPVRQQLMAQLSAGVRSSFEASEISGKASLTPSCPSFEEAQAFSFFLFD